MNKINILNFYRYKSLNILQLVIDTLAKVKLDIVIETLE